MRCLSKVIFFSLGAHVVWQSFLNLVQTYSHLSLSFRLREQLKYNVPEKGSQYFCSVFEKEIEKDTHVYNAL